MSINFIVAKSDQELKKIINFRNYMLLEEQGFSEVDLPTDDAFGCFHIMAESDGIPAGYCRIKVVNGSAKIEFICVSSQFQSGSVGGRLARKAVSFAKEIGFQYVMGTPTERMSRFWRSAGGSVSKKPISVFKPTQDKVYWFYMRVGDAIMAPTLPI